MPDIYTLTLVAGDPFGPGVPDAVEVTAIIAAAYAEAKILCAATLITGLGPNQATTKGNQNALGNFVSEAARRCRGTDGDGDLQAQPGD